mmetsp:Transcript_20138/g.65568  ORF Transcript_20138/g.65568 Transcript_20138/m.65568 type:complete len:259 (-) Transcript_20138:1323-2099(-)
MAGAAAPRATLRCARGAPALARRARPRPGAARTAPPRPSRCGVGRRRRRRRHRPARFFFLFFECRAPATHHRLCRNPPAPALAPLALCRARRPALWAERRSACAPRRSQRSPLEHAVSSRIGTRGGGCAGGLGAGSGAGCVRGGARRARRGWRRRGTERDRGGSRAGGVRGGGVGGARTSRGRGERRGSHRKSSLRDVGVSAPPCPLARRAVRAGRQTRRRHASRDAGSARDASPGTSRGGQPHRAREERGREAVTAA